MESGESVEKITPQTKGKTVLVPLTGSMYVPGTIIDTDNVIIDIGTGYYAQKVSIHLNLSFVWLGLHLNPKKNRKNNNQQIRSLCCSTWTCMQLAFINFILYFSGHWRRQRLFQKKSPVCNRTNGKDPAIRYRKIQSQGSYLHDDGNEASTTGAGTEGVQLITPSFCLCLQTACFITN